MKSNVILMIGFWVMTLVLIGDMNALRHWTDLSLWQQWTRGTLILLWMADLLMIITKLVLQRRERE